MSSTPSRPIVYETIGQLRDALGAIDLVAFVPTMGALHDGHLALIARAKELAATVVVSIFVNPLQFSPDEDLGRYPRTLEADLDRLGQLGVAAVFAPAVSELYPDNPIQTTVHAGKVGTLYEGHSRAGHFDGVLTIVAKLLHIVAPQFVVFGQKDAQQVFLVKRMVADLNFPVSVEVVATVREVDGLALSSRNRFLDPKERHAALGLSRALDAAAASADRGVHAVLAAAQGALMGEALVRLDYLVVVNPTTLLPVDDDYRGPALVLVAAVVGMTRLIDNASIPLGG